MRPLRDGLLKAMLTRMQAGDGLSIVAAASSCCPEAKAGGVTACTCWEPEYDAPQTAPDLDTVAGLLLGTTRPPVRETMCGDCAYRPNSPERTGDADYVGDTEQLDSYARQGRRFWCHDGFRQIVGWRHPSGIRLPADRSGDYQPALFDGVPFQADGQPGLLCAGWSARRRALLARDRKAVAT